MHPKIYLKAGKEKPLLARHHWVFSGAILKMEPTVGTGKVVDVYSSDHKYLGTGVFNEKTSIAVRMLSFTPTRIDANFLWDRLHRAYELRKQFFPDESVTNAYRVFHAEGDFLPGLVVDRYGTGLVVQLSVLGLEPFREDIAESLSAMMKPSFLYERSEGHSRSEEGLAASQGLLRGSLPESLVIVEDGMRFAVDVTTGQKTGFFLDQRDNRRLVRDTSKGKKVLNCFGYTGAFSVAAVAGGALRTVTVDSSAPALEAARENFRLNGIDAGQHDFIRANVMELLRKPGEKYDFIILDPPAFAKHQNAVQAAFHGYKDVNLHAIKAVVPGGLLLTCSCSAHVDAALFQKIVFTAAADAGRNVQIIRKMAQPVDHPVNLFHPETEYLKALLLRVT